MPGMMNNDSLKKKVALQHYTNLIGKYSTKLMSIGSNNVCFHAACVWQNKVYCTPALIWLTNPSLLDDTMSILLVPP